MAQTHGGTESRLRGSDVKYARSVPPRIIPAQTETSRQSQRPVHGGQRQPSWQTDPSHSLLLHGHCGRTQVGAGQSQGRVPLDGYSLRAVWTALWLSCAGPGLFG